jgi:hypothetical protein
MNKEALTPLLNVSEFADIWPAVLQEASEGVAIRPLPADIDAPLSEVEIMILHSSLQSGRFNHPGVTWTDDGQDTTFRLDEAAVRQFRIGAGRVHPLIWSSRSRFGGLPDIPADFEWPLGTDDYFEFIAQIDLSELPDFDERSLLPSAGLLSFFLDVTADQTSHDVLPIICRYFPDAHCLAAPVKHPRTGGWHTRQVWCRDSEDALDASTRAVHPTTLAMMPMLYLPDHDTVAVPPVGMQADPWPALRRVGAERIELLQSFLADIARSVGVHDGWTDTRILGEPRFAQGAVLGAGHKLLLQFPGWGPYGFGDAGNVYATIHRDDLATQCFDRVLAVWDCY